MATKETKKSTVTQRILVFLIAIVAALLIWQLLVQLLQAPPVSREDCLESGAVWSEADGRCYGLGADTSLR